MRGAEEGCAETETEPNGGKIARINARWTAMRNRRGRGGGGPFDIHRSVAPSFEISDEIPAFYKKSFYLDENIFLYATAHRYILLFTRF